MRHRRRAKIMTRRAARGTRIRLMRAADVSSIARIEGAAFGREAWPRAAFAYLSDVFAVTRPVRGRLWVAQHADGRVLGYTGIELSALGGEADIVNLAVEPACRRQGIGRRLVTAAAAYCRRRGVPLVWLRVRAGNLGARTFYRRCGFRVVGRFGDYYSNPREDAVLMALSWRKPTRPPIG